MPVSEIQHQIDEHKHAHIHTITVARPSKLNVLNAQLMRALASALASVADDDNARVVVLRGAGNKAWIGGADIAEMVTLNADTASAFITELHSVCYALRDLRVPVIAAIEGYCLGAGLEIAACCDLRISSEAAHFGMPEVRVGLPSVIEAALLPRIIGIGRTRDLVLSGRLIDAETAWRWGLLDALVPSSALNELVDARINDILACAPQAVRRQKELCKVWEEQPLTQAVNAGITAFAKAYESDEPKTYMARFLNKKME